MLGLKLNHVSKRGHWRCFPITCPFWGECTGGLHRPPVDSVHKGPVEPDLIVVFVVTLKKLMNNQSATILIGRRCNKSSLMWCHIKLNWRYLPWRQSLSLGSPSSGGSPAARPAWGHHFRPCRPPWRTPQTVAVGWTWWPREGEKRTSIN